MQISQRIPSILDTDIASVVETGTQNLTDSVQHLVITHAPNVSLTALANGTFIPLASTEYEFKQISPTQTVIKKIIAGTKSLQVVQSEHIGEATIGTNFIII